MPLFTVEQCREHLQAWLDAELAVSTGQSYKIGNRSLFRADLAEIGKRIAFWKGELEKLEPSEAVAGTRAFRVIPLDL